MLSRRAFAALPLAAALRGADRLTPRQRVDRILAGKDVDRVPFTFWYHFGLEKEPPERFANATLGFHRRFRTDLVKVMSDFPYPADSSRVYENPFAPQIRALEIIRDGLGGRAHFVETIFNPWNQAEKLSSPAAVQKMRRENPKELLALLYRIAQSEANHARRALKAGASGIFLAIANAQEGILSQAEYTEFSEPFDRIVLDAAAGAPLNILHLHGDKVYLDRFLQWPAAINYSAHATGVPLAQVRAKFRGVLLGGIDETKYRSLSSEEMQKQIIAARAAAGRALVLTPGCSVPNETAAEEMLRLTAAVGA